MTGSYPRYTIASTIEMSGLGLHSGEPVQVKLHPGGPGLLLQTESRTRKIRPSGITGTDRCTSLFGVSTVEHLLSALAGCNITDCAIEVSGGELPAADGCALPYVEAILTAGKAPCGTLEVDGPFARVFLQQDSIKIAAGYGSGLWKAQFVLSDYFVGEQSFELDWFSGKYKEDVAPARTIVLEHELEAVKELGLGKGLSEASCLVVGREKYLSPARFVDEPVRHKLLDLIGDLYLTGIPMAHLNVAAERNGHESNVSIARKLSQAVMITYRN